MDLALQALSQVNLLTEQAVSFNSSLVISGSLAAGFQSWMYGGFTPAGGIFAVLTSIGAIGFLHPPLIIQAAIISSLVTTIVAGIRGDLGWAL